MSQCQVVSPVKSSYNAVNIRINNPKAFVSDKTECGDCKNDYNAINMEVNYPELSPVYSYPEYGSVVTSDMANINTVKVPEPNLTNTENEKKNLSFNGLNFKASNKPEIITESKVKPAVDIEQTTRNLESADYDVQAKQLEGIFLSAIKDSALAIPYINANIFSQLINIAEKDVTSLEGPSEEQVKIREKIITNKIYEKQQLDQGKAKEDIKLPYEVSDAEFAKAIILSPKELAGRNKEYALMTLAALAKVYGSEYEKKTGNVLPLTDLPGASSMVEALKKDNNPSVKAAAIESLVYINRKEYNKEISAVLTASLQDKNPLVAGIAAEALRNITAN